MAVQILKTTCAFVLLALLGCGGGTLPVNGGEDQYTLELVVEKNLDYGADYLYVRFLRNGITISNGFVAVGSDTIRANALSTSICLDPTVYPGDHWEHGQQLTIVAVDDSTGFRYEDAIAVPDSFGIDNFIPANHLWQGGNVQVEWTGSQGVTAYIVSMAPDALGSPAPGFAGRDDQGVRAMTIPPAAFLDPEDNLPVAGLYSVNVIGYARNFVRRACAEYLSPSVGLDDPIDDVQIDGALSAIVVSVRDTIRVEQSL
jgi:hypothetical protein